MCSPFYLEVLKVTFKWRPNRISISEKKQKSFTKLIKHSHNARGSSTYN